MKQLHLTFPYGHQQQHDQCCIGCSLISIININFVVTYVQNTSSLQHFLVLPLSESQNTACYLYSVT